MHTQRRREKVQRRSGDVICILSVCHSSTIPQCCMKVNTLYGIIFTMSTDNPLYWATFRQQADHHMYFELEFLGRNRWQVVIGDDEFILRTKERDFLTVLSLAIAEHQDRSDQESPTE